MEGPPTGGPFTFVCMFVLLRETASGGPRHPSPGVEGNHSRFLVAPARDDGPS
jgi:hypothetical protein